MPTDLCDYRNSFNKNIIQELRRQIFQSQEFDQEYSHKDSHDYDWVQFTIHALLRDYESGSLKKEHSEAWCMAYIWNFIDTVFSDEDKITVLRNPAVMTQAEEYGALVVGKTYDGDQATKRLEESLVEPPKCLKNMLDNILPNCDDNKKLQTIGFIHSGLQSYVVRADYLTKYIIRIQKSRKYHLLSDISQFGTSVLPAIYIA